MNRLERVREIIGKLLQRDSDAEQLRWAHVHLYGVSATAILLARTRGLDEDIAGVAGMLHDLATYETQDPANHGPRSAARAGQILRSIGEFSDAEIEQIQSAISHHSDKAHVHGSYEELLKDADVLQHDLYNPALEPCPGHEERRARLRSSLE
ncbi:HD domain-containing protein [Candidatus Bipolaricaulota bacterium]